MKKLLVILMIGLSTILKAHEEENLIVELHINKNFLKVQINKDFQKMFLRDDFFVMYEKDIRLDQLPYSIVTMPFICNVAPIVWISNYNYAIDEMDEDLYYSLEKVKTVLKRIYPNTAWNGNLIPKKLVQNRSPLPLKDPEYNTALLFSGGLDSTSSSYKHVDKNQLLITAWGQPDVPVKNKSLWNERKKEFIHFAKKFGHKNVFVKSNYSSFLNWQVLNNLSNEVIDWRLCANEGLSLLGVCAPILYVRGYATLRIASSYTWDFPYPMAANPLIDDHIVFAGGIRLKHDEFDSSRIDKLQNILSVAQEKSIEMPTLKICDNQRIGNCLNDCDKCMPTLIGALALNEDLKTFNFDITREEAIARAKKYIQKPRYYWSLWQILCVKNKLQNSAAQGKAVAKDMAWLINTDLRRNVTFNYKEKKKVYWPDFQDIAPEGLKIPQVRNLNLLD